MTPDAFEDWIYLKSYIAPLETALRRQDVTDIYVNRPGELWLETLGGTIERHDVPELDEVSLMRLARQIAALNNQGINREHPLLSGRLPDGSRIQIIMPPATRGLPALAIRKHVSADLSLDDYIASGAFEEVSQSNASVALPSTSTEIATFIANGDIASALRTAVRQRLNILISGGTSTGKTTFLNALMREIPAHERLILIEDTPEIKLRHDNAVGLLAARSALGEARVTANDLVSASLRMRPDRIILGELRGVEAFAFLRAINTGHPGSISTIHANSAEGAIEQLALLILEGGSTLSREDIIAYANMSISIVVQLHRHKNLRMMKELKILGPH